MARLELTQLKCIFTSGQGVKINCMGSTLGPFNMTPNAIQSLNFDQPLGAPTAIHLLFSNSGSTIPITPTANPLSPGTVNHVYSTATNSDRYRLNFRVY